MALALKNAKKLGHTEKATQKQLPASASPKQSAPSLTKSAVKLGDFLYFEPAGVKVYEVDGSTIKGTGYKHLCKFVETKDAVLIRANSLRLAVVVNAEEANPAVAASRLSVDVAFFRANYYAVGRLSRYIQEPIIVRDEENNPYVVVLPRASEEWGAVAAPLKPQAAPAQVNTPITQIVLPPNLPADQIKIAETIGDRIGSSLAGSIQELTAAFRGFTRDAALAAVVAGDEAGKSGHD